MGRFFFLVTLAALFTGACSVFVSLDGLATPDNDAATEAGSDASIDTGTDARIDAGPDVYDFVCPDASIVCDDFDDNPLGALWSNVAMQGPALLAIDDGGALSPPNSLLLTLAQNPQSLLRWARLERTFGPVPTVECSFDMLFEKTDASGSQNVRLLELEMYPPGYSEYRVYVEMELGRLVLAQEITQTNSDAGRRSWVASFLMPNPMGAWRKVRVFTDWKQVHVDVDGATALDHALIDPIVPPKGTIRVGMTYDRETPAWSYRIDDVLCR